MNYTKLKGPLKRHLSDSTAISVFAVPVCAAMETSVRLCELMSKIPYVDVSPISVDVSMKTRAYGIGLGYLGLASVLSKGRKLSRKLFNVTDKSKETVQWLHDTAYLIGFNAIINPVLYYASGARDSKEILGGTFALTIFSAIGGGPIGYTMDAFRDLTGLDSCERKLYPDLIKEQSPRTKKTLAALLTAGAVAATAAVYTFN